MTTSESGKRSRNKGGRGERAAADLLRLAFPEVRRRFSSEESQGTKLGRDLSGTPGFAFQVQLAKVPTLEKKFLEALSVAEQDEVAVALTRRCAKGASCKWLATLEARALVGLLHAKNEARRLAAEELERLLVTITRLEEGELVYQKQIADLEAELAEFRLEKERALDPFADGA